MKIVRFEVVTAEILKITVFFVCDAVKFGMSDNTALHSKNTVICFIILSYFLTYSGWIDHVRKYYTESSRSRISYVQ